MKKFRLFIFAFIMSFCTSTTVSLVIVYFNNNDNNFNLVKRLDIGERIRDMIYYNNKLYLYLEDTASLAEISFN